MFVGPVYPPLEPEDYRASQGDLYKQFINELGAFRAWIFDGATWLEYADMSDMTFELPWPDQPAEDGDVYWSGPTKWVMMGDAWVVATQNLKPPPAPDPITGPESPNFPTDPPPQDGDTHTDQHGNLWWWYLGSWNTKPESPTGDIFTFDVKTDPAEKQALTDALRVIPDIDITDLDHQKDVNWAISNALTALDDQVEINSARIADMTMLIPGASYEYLPASTHPRPPATGKFYLSNGITFTDVFGEVFSIMIHHTDSTGTEHTLENIAVDDTIIIEHHLDAHSFGRYQVTQVFHNDNDSLINVSVISHRGGVQLGEKYDVLAFPDIDVTDKPSYSYVDQGLAQKINRSGSNDLDTDQSAWRLQSQTKTFQNINGTEMGLYHVKEPTQFHHAATKGYVDELTTISDQTPAKNAEGYLWFDNAEDVMQLSIYHSDSGAWIPVAPPTGIVERVAMGEAIQQAIMEQIEDSLVDQATITNNISDLQSDKLDKTGGTLTGGLTFKRTDDVSYWNYITSDTPTAWHSSEAVHGLILRVGTTNTYKQQFKIQGRSNKDLFEIHDDGAAQARIEGNLNVKNHLKENGKRVATLEYVDSLVISESPGALPWKFVGTSVLAEDLAPGEFTFRYEGDQGTNGTFKIYTSIYDASGQLIASPTTFQHNMSDHLIMSIQGIDGGNHIHMKSKTFYFHVVSGDHRYHRFEARFWRVATSCTVGENYILNIPGLLPTYGKPADSATLLAPPELPDQEIPPQEATS